MSIQPLPSATVRLLGSSVNIPAPPALVKELLDNAIDAGGTTIEVAISPNTVDKVQVRDNGAGISMDDFDSLGRRAHTSKLRTFSELQNNEVRTLGFRGEALASANSLAVVSVTTRTTEDPIATRFRLKFGVGGVENLNTVSAPVGTTIKAEHLFQALPVRRQQALKESRKSLSKIKQLLQAYALARPHLKLSLKVLGDPKQSWAYAPSLTPSSRDATMQIFGKALATECEAVESNSMMGKDTLARMSGELARVCTMKALLPMSTCDPKLLNGKGAFVSVDSRPLSSTIGIGKKLVSVFKSCYNSAEQTGQVTKLTAPFLQVDIQCWGIVYDFNVTPLKDEVIFQEEDKIVAHFEALCQKVYRRSSDSLTKHTTETQTQRNEAPANQDHVNRRAHALQTQTEVAQSNDKELGEGHTGTFGNSEMRTMIKVDLGRTTSSATDEDATANMVMVRVPPKPLMPGKCDFVSSKPKCGSKALDPPRTFQDMHRYFKTKGKDNFQIATDETATEEHSSEAVTLGEPEAFAGKNTERRPLKPLAESTLNQMSRDANDGLEYLEVDVDSDILPHPNTQTRMLPPESPARTHRDVTPRRSVRLPSTPPHTSRQESAPDHNAQFSSHVTALRQGVLHNLMALQSPPPSTPRPLQRRSNLPFRPPAFLMGEDTRSLHEPVVGIPNLTRETAVSTQQVHTSNRISRAPRILSLLPKQSSSRLDPMEIDQQQPRTRNGDGQDFPTPPRT